MSKYAQEAYEMGKLFYKQDRSYTNLQTIEYSKKMAVRLFWEALCLGNKKAAYALYECFCNGEGVEQNNHLAIIMYGVAKQLGDPKCDFVVKFSPSITQNIIILSNLVSKAETAKLTKDNFDAQLKVFSKALSLNSGSRPAESNIMECIYSKKELSTESKHSEQGENKEEEPATTVVTGEVDNCVSCSTCVIL